MNKEYVSLFIPFIAGAIGMYFTKSELLLSLIILLTIVVTLYVLYNKGEWKVLLAGLLFGAIIEIGGDLIYQLQYWDHGSILGKPVWLFLFWAYAFFFIRRIGNLLVKEK